MENTHSDQALFKNLLKSLNEYFEEEKQEDPQGYGEFDLEDHNSANSATTYRELIETTRSNAWDFYSFMDTLIHVLRKLDSIKPIEMADLLEALKEIPPSTWST